MTTEDVHDSEAARTLLETYLDEPGRLLKLVWVDTAYQGPAMDRLLKRRPGRRDCPR